MFSRDELVRKKQNSGVTGTIVDGPARRPGGNYWRVRQADGTIANWRESSIEVVPLREDPRSAICNGRFGRHADFSRYLTFLRLKDPLKDNLYSMEATKTDYYAHQFKPIIKFLDNPTQRLLIADEVGLGKTIEAGLILTELRARGHLNRVLVVCPASLREKWRHELREKFGEDFALLESKSQLKSAINDWVRSGKADPFYGIVSLQTLRLPDARAILETTDFSLDLSIVDEAHHMRNTGRHSNRLGALLSEISDAMLMLTATPLNLRTSDLFNLLQILDPDDFDDEFVFDRFIDSNQYIIRAEGALRPGEEDLPGCRRNIECLRGNPLFEKNPLLHRVCQRLEQLGEPDPEFYVGLRRDISSLSLLSRIFNRTRKNEVFEDAAQRRPIVLDVIFTEQERKIYDAITDHVRSKYNAADSRFEAFVLMMPQRQAASCLPAMMEKYQISFDDAETYEDADEDRTAQNLDDQPELIRFAAEIEKILAGADIPQVDSKYDALLKFLRNRDDCDAKIILFSTFKSTLRYLEKRLASDGMELRVVHGDIKGPERSLRVEAFRDDAAVNVLLTSEVSSEGLDFQFCSTLINYDLPWNPMVVEQRIGRLDRLGQQSDVIHIVNFKVADTIEERILERLYQRIGIFEESIGLLEGILGDIVREFTDELLASQLTPKEQGVLLDQKAQAIVANKKDQEIVEEKASRFVGLDGFVNREIDNIRKDGRYITPAELRQLVIGFIDHHFPRTRYECFPEYSDNTYILHPDERFCSALRGMTRKPGQVMPYRLFDASRSVHITFDPDIAAKYSEVEFINLQHSLVRVAIERYSHDKSSFPMATQLALHSNLVSPGTYIFMIHRLQTQGLSREVRLHCTSVHAESNGVTDPAVADRLLSQMLLSGTATRHSFDLPSDTIIGCMDMIDEAFHVWMDGVVSDAEDRNEAIVRMRMASVEAHFDRRVRRQTELRERYIADGKTAQAKGAETRAANLGSACHDALSKLEAGLAFDPEFGEVIGGVLYVE